MAIPLTLEPNLRLIVAPNPSPMTEMGTNTWLLGDTELAVIDPGPDDDSHLDAILAAVLPGQHVSHILLTHTHLDHSGLAPRLSNRTGALVHGFGSHLDGRRPIMQQLETAGLAGGGEGVHVGYTPDIELSDGAKLNGEGWEIEVLWTPGHVSNHLTFAWNGALFTGDHIMSWASSLVSPPDGDLTAFMNSCRKLQQRSDRIYYPGHGEPAFAPRARLDWLIAHRERRERQILTSLATGPQTVETLTGILYADVAPNLLPAAGRNVFAHLIALCEQGQASAEPDLSTYATFDLANKN